MMCLQFLNHFEGDNPVFVKKVLELEVFIKKIVEWFVYPEISASSDEDCSNTLKNIWVVNQLWLRTFPFDCYKNFFLFGGIFWPFLIIIRKYKPRTPVLPTGIFARQRYLYKLLFTFVRRLRVNCKEWAKNWS